MQSMFDTRRAVFEPDQVSHLLRAFQAAMAQLGPGVTANTERKLGKVVITIARRKIAAGDVLDAGAVAAEAAGFISQLRLTQWLS